MAQTKPKAGLFFGVSGNGTDGQFLQTDGTGGMAWADTTIDPTLTSIDYPGTQTAADPAGGESIIINGTGFQTGITCTIGGTSATTAFNSATQITITSPAKAAGQYTVLVTNTDGGSGSSANFIQYSGVPVWSTASGSLGSVAEGATASFQVTATEGSDTIEYAVTSGSLPSGLSLAAATGAITGTAGSVSADTTSTFSITATDDENQTSSARSFSITVTNLAPSGFINAKIYTGNGSNAGSYPSIGGSLDVATDFTPDLVIVKARDAATGWVVGDSVRGNYGYMYLNSTSPSGSACGGYGSNPCGSANGDGGIGIGTNKFIVKDDASGNYGVSGPGTLYQAFAWKAGGAPTATNSGGQTPTLGSKMIDGSASTTNFATATEYPSKQTISTAADFSMSLITKTTATDPLQVPHGLSGTPDFVMLKQASGSGDWLIYHTSVGTGKYLSTTRNDQGGGAGTDTPVTSALSFSTVNADIIQNKWTNSNWYWMCYAWKSKAGFSKFGTYTGNGSAFGPMIETGFKPAIIIIKRTDAAANWRSFNDATSTSNPLDKETYPNLANVESTFVGVSFHNNGFQLQTSDSNSNANNGTYIYAAWAADGSTATPTLANSYSNKLWTPNTSSTALSLNVGFKPTVFWSKYRQGTQGQYFNFDKWVTTIAAGESGGREFPNLAGQASNNTYLYSYDPTGVTVNPQLINRTQTDSAISWAWKAGDGFSINTTGDQPALVSVNQAAGISFISSPSAPSSAGYTFAHGLSKAPELFMYKATNYSYAYEVLVPKTFGVDAGSLTYSDWDYNKLNQTNAFTTSTWYAADNSVIKSNGWAASSYNFICFAFHSVANFSKINKYTGDGTAGHAIAVGFAPDYVLIKRMTDTGNWYIFDSARKTGVYSDQLEANTGNAENTGTYVELTSTGFSLNTTASNLNESGDTFLYMAFKQN